MQILTPKLLRLPPFNSNLMWKILADIPVVSLCFATLSPTSPRAVQPKLPGVHGSSPTGLFTHNSFSLEWANPPCVNKSPCCITIPAFQFQCYFCNSKLHGWLLNSVCLFLFGMQRVHTLICIDICTSEGNVVMQLSWSCGESHKEATGYTPQWTSKNSIRQYHSSVHQVLMLPSAALIRYAHRVSTVKKC